MSMHQNLRPKAESRENYMAARWIRVGLEWTVKEADNQMVGITGGRAVNRVENEGSEADRQNLAKTRTAKSALGATEIGRRGGILINNRAAAEEEGELVDLGDTRNAFIYMFWEGLN